jgi:nitroreductase
MNNHAPPEELLSIAVHAPSGDNSQPWRFKIADPVISIFNVPSADSTLYNFKQRGSYLAHGALIENIAIAASKMGYKAAITPFPGTPECTASIALDTSQPVEEPLYDFITARTTNRKPYQIKGLSFKDRSTLLHSIQGYASVQLRFVEKREEIRALSKTLSINERLLMENKNLHDFLFGMIRWSKREEEKKPGLYLKTMELPVPVQIMFRLVLRYWGAVRLLNLFGLSKAIPKQSAAGYEASSAFGAIIISGETDTDFLQAGRTFQRMWLTATRLKLSVQPVTAIPYLMQRVSAGKAEAFSIEHQSMIRSAYTDIAYAFDLQGSEHIAMLFRVGYDGEPSARSSKVPPVITQET